MTIRGPGFAQLIHADWSVRAAGRWAAVGTRRGETWHATAPFPVPPLATYVDDLLAHATHGPVLAGFDFPIGLPVAYGERTGRDGFAAVLAHFDDNVLAVASKPDDIGLARPFYPARPGGARLQHLLDGHGVTGLSSLVRRCERGGGGLKPAGCLFWTMGASQVGRAALNGWRHVIGPAVERGASLWPFDGDLETLARGGGLTLAETYPADGYARLGAPFRRGESKRRPADRASKAAPIENWAARTGVTLDPPLRAALREGFGSADRGGDRFDAVVGLFAMIDVLAATPLVDAPRDDVVRNWEGWILGRPR